MTVENSVEESYVKNWGYIGFDSVKEVGGDTLAKDNCKRKLFSSLV